MSLQYILGLPGVGKTTRCLVEILEKNQEADERLLLYLVPEQATLQSEQRLVGLMPSAAMSHVQVLSFQRLAYYLFSKTGAAAGVYLDDIGKNMLLRKIVLDLRHDLLFYAKSADKQGFMDGLSATISEFQRYGVSAMDLRTAQTAADNEIIRVKLLDLARIYERYAVVMKDMYFSAEDSLDLLPDKISAGTELDGAFVWVDGFHGFTLQERRVLERIIQKASVRMTATVDKAANIFEDLHPSDFFYETKNTVNQITNLANGVGAHLEKPVLIDKKQSFSEMDHFLRQYAARQPSVYQNQAENFKLFASVDKSAEVEAIVFEIERLTREENLRYRDIAVVTGDIAAYEKICRRVFRQHSIPLFLDAKKDILAHPLTELIRAAVSVAVHRWSYESVFRFLRTNLTGISMDQLDAIENYVLANGVKGYHWQSKTWAFGGESEEVTAEIISIKEMAQAALAPFTDGITQKKQSIRTFATNIFDMLTQLRVTETLDRWIRQCLEDGENEVARQHGQIWGKICSVFDKLVEILGDERLTVAEFEKILDAGFLSIDMGMIPPTIDQVVVGDLTRSRLPDIQIMFVLGANEGLLPKPAAERTFLADGERAFLQRRGLELGPDPKRKVGEEFFLLFCGIAKARRRLVLSFCLSDGGKPLRPSVLIARTRQMFPRLIVQFTGENEIVSAKPMLNRMSGYLQKYASGEEWKPEIWDAYSALREDPKCAALMEKIENFLRSKDDPYQLSEKSISKLYGRVLSTSVSRLEKYRECPFAYFLQYNLGAAARKIYEVGSMDTGTLFHDVLERFAQKLAEEERSWRRMKVDEIESLVDNCVDDCLPNADTGGVFFSSERYKYMVNRIRRICKRSVWALAEHLRRGKFDPLGAEMRFSQDALTGIDIRLNGDRKLMLTGRIDRADVMVTAGSLRYIKVIDYKSGHKQFDLDDVYFGTQLQLLLYMNALIQNGRAFFGDSAEYKLLPGGVFYFNINDPIVNPEGIEEDITAERLNELILRTFKMSGLVLANKEVVRGMDEEISGESALIPVSVRKSDGEFGKNASVLDETDYRALLDQVMIQAAAIGNEIVSGRIAAYPYKKGRRTGCDYCPYGAVCALEAGETQDHYNIVKRQKAGGKDALY